MKKSFCLLLSAALILSVLSGCDQSKPGAPDAELSPTPVLTVSPKPSAEPSAEPSVEPSAEPSVAPSKAPVKQEVLLFETSFDEFTDGFGPRGSETVELASEDSKDGSSCLFVTNRTENWNGAQKDVTDLMEYGKTYKIAADVKCSENASINLTTEMHSGDSVSYSAVKTLNGNAGEWVHFDITYNFFTETDTIAFYFETDNKADFYVDNFKLAVIETSSVEDPACRPSLAETYQDLFKIGVAIGPDEIKNPKKAALVKYHFNSITTGNEFKPDYLLAQQASKDGGDEEHAAVNFKNIDTFCTWARENNIQVRFHTLVWHNQTPKWFFREGFDNNADYVSSDVMAKRLENYIKDVCTYINDNYEDVIYCYDVVNEAMSDGYGDDGVRNEENPWYDTLGRDYIRKAFEYARKYASPNHKLFYNDYGCSSAAKRQRIVDYLTDLAAEGLVDGVGMQSHYGISLNDPASIDYKLSIKAFSNLGLEVQITELDIGLDDNSEQKMKQLATRYVEFFKLYKSLQEDPDNGVNITAVTVWGLTDDGSWLNGTSGTDQYPLLFNSDYSGKLCLDKIIEIMQ